MKRLKNFKKSQVNRIEIEYEGEKISFNLFEEVKINEVMLQKELKEQPSYYGFLMLLHKKLVTRFEDLKRQRKKTYGKLFFQAKHQIVNNRPMSDELAKSWVESSKQFNLISKKCIEAKDQADTIYSCIQAFSQRKDLLQTLSSNIRKNSY